MGSLVFVFTALQEKLAAAMRNRNKDEVKLQLEEWVKLKDMPEQRQFNLEQYCKDAMRGLNGQGLIKVELFGCLLVMLVIVVSCVVDAQFTTCLEGSG